VYKNINNYSGAWLTDIDDTLIRSGHYPDDEWIDSLANFIRRLQKHNIIWVPVSGVAINKMGSRLLFRLPKDVLSHVIYYGGEGGIKSYYDNDAGKWHSPEYFQRKFSDAQALVIIGESRFTETLIAQYDADDTDKREHEASVNERVRQRIDAATKLLDKTHYRGMPGLVDQMESMLTRAGYDSARAETYYRGGAISWMMFGDVSVQNYKGDHETTTRTDINAFIKNKLAELDYLKDIGDDGVHMPYLHATRGIKLILMGNDKGRAADDLIEKESIAPESLLFVGNELFEGGNDNPVRRVNGVSILSVGENMDPGVIDGGVQVDANQYWMNFLAKSLDSESWVNILQKLPDTALSVRVRKKIDMEKKYAYKISSWHDGLSKKIPTDLLYRLYVNYRDIYTQTREKLLKVKRTQYELVARLSVLDKYHYDNARKIVMQLVGDHSAEIKKDTAKEEVKKYLLPEISGLLKLLLVDHLHLSEKLVTNKFDSLDDLSMLRDVTNQLIEQSGAEKKTLEFERKNQLIENWDASIDELVDSYFEYLRDWEQSKTDQFDLIKSDEAALNGIDDVSIEELSNYFRWLISRIEHYPHLKDLDKPTIVLVAGTSGVGKSTISRHISKTLGIPTAFSSDVASRSVVRETISFLLGKERAKQLFPEVIGSSFEEDSLDWFYAHSLMTMVGVVGNINRLIKENISAVIDGVALIPGSLPEILFEKANIVWVVACVSDREKHFERLGTRSETGVERGGAERYRDQFSAIRRNHDRLVEMAEKTDTHVVDNSGPIDKVFISVLERVKNPLADRGLYAEDKIREKVYHHLHERTTWDIQNILHDI
jgi:2-phosphoglycerate kinase